MTHALNFRHLAVRKLKPFQEFIFVSDSTIKQRAKKTDQLQLSLNNSFLSEVEIGNFINIEQIDAPRNIIRQLRSLKFQPSKRCS